MTIVIRRADETDLPRLEALFGSAIGDAFGNNGIPAGDDLAAEIEEKVRLLETHFRSRPPLSRFWVACGDDRILGIAGHFPANRDIRSRLGLDFSMVPEIGCAYVSPAVQGRGIGKQLLASALRSLQAASVGSFCLDCGYPRSQLVWKKLLGDPVHVEPNRWGSGRSYMIWLKRVEEVITRFPGTETPDRKGRADP